ncbi:MAG: hypothetical protein IPF66_23530 [Holophagales bacterium]|nr:hypothetical protein [Holophagales bacterium]
MLRRLPLIGAASPGRLAVLVGLSVPVLAALAASAPRRDRRALAIGSTVALLLVSVVAATMRPEAADPAARTAFRRASAWAAAFPAGGFALALAPLGPGARAAGLLALAATERLSTMRGYLPSLEPDAIYPCGVACDLLRQTPDGYRVAGLALALGPNQAAVLGLEDIRAYENLTWAPLEETTHLWRRPAFPGRRCSTIRTRLSSGFSAYGGWPYRGALPPPQAGRGSTKVRMAPSTRTSSPCHDSSSPPRSPPLSRRGTWRF